MVDPRCNVALYQFLLEDPEPIEITEIFNLLVDRFDPTQTEQFHPVFLNIYHNKFYPHIKILIANSKFSNPQQQFDKEYALIQAIDTIGLSINPAVPLTDFIATYAFNPEALDDKRLQAFEMSLITLASIRNANKQFSNLAFSRLLDLAAFYHFCRILPETQNFSAQPYVGVEAISKAISQASFKYLYSAYKAETERQRLLDPLVPTLQGLWCAAEADPDCDVDLYGLLIDTAPFGLDRLHVLDRILNIFAPRFKQPDAQQQGTKTAF